MDESFTKHGPFYSVLDVLTHWGRVCIHASVNQATFVSDNLNQYWVSVKFSARFESNYNKLLENAFEILVPKMSGNW